MAKATRNLNCQRSVVQSVKHVSTCFRSFLSIFSLFPKCKIFFNLCRHALLSLFRLWRCLRDRCGWECYFMIWYRSIGWDIPNWFTEHFFLSLNSGSRKKYLWILGCIWVSTGSTDQGTPYNFAHDYYWVFIGLKHSVQLSAQLSGSEKIMYGCLPWVVN